MIDSGASHCYVPPKAYKALIKEIIRGKDCSLDDVDGLYKCDCNGIDDSYKTINFELGSQFLRNWVQLSPKNYVWYDVNRDKCWITIAEETQTVEEWILGDPFLMGYTAMFNYETM